MTDVPAGTDLLVVCTANVCRSPLVESVLRRRLPRASRPLASAGVSSAGTHAIADAPMCPVSAEEASEDAFARSHRARLLDAGMVRGAALVVTAEREHRGVVARLAPGSQNRVFTFAEAAALAELATARILEGEADLPTDLRAVAALLHSSRGRIPLPAPEPSPRRLLGFRRRSVPVADPLDLVDGHGRAPDVHLAAVRKTHELAERLAAALQELCDPR